jgi:hypothetical protein
MPILIIYFKIFVELELTKMPLLILTLESRSSRVSLKAFSSATTDSMGTTAPPDHRSIRLSHPLLNGVYGRPVDHRCPVSSCRISTTDAFALEPPLSPISLGSIWLESVEVWSLSVPKI